MLPGASWLPQATGCPATLWWPSRSWGDACREPFGWMSPLDPSACDGRSGNCGFPEAPFPGAALATLPKCEKPDFAGSQPCRPRGTSQRKNCLKLSLGRPEPKLFAVQSQLLRDWNALSAMRARKAFDCVLCRVEKGCGGFWRRKGAVGLALGIPLPCGVLAPAPSPAG